MTPAWFRTLVCYNTYMCVALSLVALPKDKVTPFVSIYSCDNHQITWLPLPHYSVDIDKLRKTIRPLGTNLKNLFPADGLLNKIKGEVTTTSCTHTISVGWVREKFKHLRKVYLSLDFFRFSSSICITAMYQATVVSLFRKYALIITTTSPHFMVYWVKYSDCQKDTRLPPLRIDWSLHSL